MRLRAAYCRDGKWDRDSGAQIVSEATARAYKNPSFVLFIREAGKRATSGAIFIFNIPPQSLTVDRAARHSIVDTRHGYVVSEAGLSAPVFTLKGHFGWQLRTVKAPPQIRNLALKSNVRYDQHGNDLFIQVPGTNEKGAESLVEKIFQGRRPQIFGFEQTLDGREAYFALRDIIVYYHEENSKRMAQGKATYEMVFLDTLHDHRWVVSPGYPRLERTVQTQGTHPYFLELIGVYDDARPRSASDD